MTSNRFQSRRSLAYALAVILAAVSGAAHAQTTYTWTGGGADSNWNTSGNWLGGVPANSGNTVLVFSGSTRTSTNNNITDWNLSIGRLEFASGASSFTLGGNAFGFNPYLGSQTQQIFQNSANTQTIGVSAFSFRNGADSQINLNAGDLIISSPNMYIDMNSGIERSLFVTGNDSTRRTVTFAGNVNKGESGKDPDMYIGANKRALVTGSLAFGSGNDASVFVNDGVLQFSGAGTMTGGVPVIGNTSGSANAALRLDTAGSTFARQLEIRGGSSGQRIVGGVNTSGTVTFSGNLVATNSPSDYDLKAASGGAANFSGTRNFDSGLRVNRADADGTYGGTVILSGPTNSNSWTALYAGTLQFSDFNQLGSSHLEFNATSGDSGTLRYTGGSTTTTKTLFIDNPGITRAGIDVSQAGTTLTWNPGTSNLTQNLTKTGAGSLSFGGAITGGSVSVESGLLSLTAGNSYAGGTTVTAGALEVSAGGSEGGSAAGLGTGAVTIASGGQVTYWLSQSSSHTIANAFSLSGGTLYTEDGANTFSGQVTLASGASTISSRYEDTIRLSGGLAGAGNVLFTQAGGTGSWAAPTFVLSGTGASTGTVRVSGSSGGGATKLQLANVNALQSATLDMATGDVGTVEFTVPGTNTYALGGLQGGRNLAFGGNSLSVGGNNQSTTYSGTLSGSGLLTKVGNGTLTLSGSNSASGGVAVDAGTLAVGSANALGSSGTISFGGGTLQYSASNTTDYSGRFSNAASQQYSIDTNGQNVTLGSNLTSSGGSFTKLGGGNLILSGSSTYSGATTVSAGRLSVNGALGSTAVTVQNGAEVGGSGSIGGVVNVLAGGTLSPGNSIQSLAVGATTFSGSSTFEYEYDSTNPASLAAAADLLVVNGNLTINAGAILTLTDLAGSPTPFVNYTTTFALISYSGAWNNGLFTYNGNALADGDWFLVGSQEWQIDYNRTLSTGLANFTGDYLTGGSFVAITAVPEPSTWAMALAGLACGAGIVSRRRLSRA